MRWCMSYTRCVWSEEQLVQVNSRAFKLTYLKTFSLAVFALSLSSLIIIPLIILFWEFRSYKTPDIRWIIYLSRAIYIICFQSFECVWRLGLKWEGSTHNLIWKKWIQFSTKWKTYESLVLVFVEIHTNLKGKDSIPEWSVLYRVYC